jgi:hypothetical protein
MHVPNLPDLVQSAKQRCGGSSVLMRLPLEGLDLVVFGMKFLKRRLSTNSVDLEQQDAEKNAPIRSDHTTETAPDASKTGVTCEDQRSAFPCRCTPLYAAGTRSLASRGQAPNLFSGRALPAPRAAS